MDSKKKNICPDCDGGEFDLDRRGFLKTVAAATTAAAGRRPVAVRHAQDRGGADAQERRRDRRQGALRHADRRPEERRLLRLGLQGPAARPAAHARLQQLARSPSRPSTATSTPRTSRQLDPRHLQGHHQSRLARAAPASSSRTTPAASRGARGQSIAIFGKPGSGKFEFVMTGRHMTMPGRRQQRRRTSPSAARSSTATPPAASTRRSTIPATSSGTRPCWPTRSTQMLDGKQQKQALVAKRPSRGGRRLPRHGRQVSRPAAGRD